MQISFRIASEADVSVCAALFSRTVIELGPQLYSKEQVRAWAKSPFNIEKFSKFILDPVTFIAINHGNQVLGFSGIEANGHIASLYVAPESSRRGVGSALLQRVIDYSQASHIQKLYAEASFFSKPLFLKFGFVVDSIEEVDYNDVRFRRFKVILHI